MKGILEIVEYLAESCLLNKGVGKIIENETKNKGGFLGMLMATLSSSLLENMLKSKEGTVEGTIRAIERTIRGCPNF